MPTKVVNIVDRRSTQAAIHIGNENDNLAERIQFVLPARLAGAAVFLYLSIGDYADVVELSDDRIYAPTRTHTQYPGRWVAYLQAQMDGDVVWHSDVFALYVGDLPFEGERIEQAYPTAIEEALRAVDTLTGVNARAVTLAPGSEATVELEEDDEGNRTIVYGIPRGRDGAGGDGGGGFAYEIGRGLKVEEDGVTLSVDTADAVEADNTLPITSAAVHVTVGNINALLETI